MFTLRKSCIKGTQFLKYIIKNMVDQNKRINTGTEHSLKSVGKIGGDFKKGPNAEFLKLRTEVFEKLFAQQQEFFKSLPRENIVITLKDGKKVDGTSFQTTPLEIAKKCLKRSMIDDLLAAKVRYTKKIVDLSAGLTSAEDEETSPEDEKFTMWDLERPLEGDCEIEYVTFDDKDGKVVFWHSSAHILGSALENLYGAYLCIGPPLENGFYYDAYVGENVSK
jgi:threonyl-tRNA synthetase